MEESEEEEESMDTDSEPKNNSPQCSHAPIENTEDIPQSDIAPIPDCIRFALVTFQDLELKTESQQCSTVSIEDTEDRVEDVPQSNAATISNCISFASVTFQFEVKCECVTISKRQSCVLPTFTHEHIVFQRMKVLMSL